jgi:hypothetical protein
MNSYPSTALKTFAILTLVILGLCGAGMSQQVTMARLQPGDDLSALEKSSAAEPTPAAMPLETSFAVTHVHPVGVEHRFWDRENSFLFATNAAFSAADFVINPVTGLFAGSTAGLVVNFAGEAAGVVGLSYMLHRTGHHRLERLVSVVNIGSSAAAVSFDLAHR